MFSVNKRLIMLSVAVLALLAGVGVGLAGGAFGSPSPDSEEEVDENSGESNDVEAQGADDEDAQGSVRVFARPGGEIFIDGEPTGYETPETIELEAGTYDVTVHHGDEHMSDITEIEMRDELEIRLMFREDDMIE